MTDNFDASQTAPACQQGALATEADLDALVADLREAHEDCAYHPPIPTLHSDAADALTALRAERGECDKRAGVWAEAAGVLQSRAMRAEAERDEWKAAAEARHANPADFRYWEGRYRDEKARAEAAEARVSALQGDVEKLTAKVAKTKEDVEIAWESQQKSVRYNQYHYDRAEAAEARALAAEAAALERAGLAVADHLDANPAVISAACGIIRALITPAARTALDTALADARKAGKMDGLMEANALVETAQWARNRLEAIADESWRGDARDFKRSLIGVFADFDEALAKCGSVSALAARVEGGDA